MGKSKRKSKLKPKLKTKPKMKRDIFSMNNYRFTKEDKRRLAELKEIENDVLRKIKKRVPNKTYALTQSSFEGGTFRITKPGRYILKEDIIFAPNPSNDFRPQRGDPKYSARPFSLGFFAAITIEVDGVEIDLNGKTLKQSDEMAWMQRFYANIETASSPFINGQGPGDFGKSITSPKYVYIHNGTLGRSSHHGIHGNGNDYLVVENVKMVDYEFIGSAINGGNYIVHRDCQILHNFKDLKVLASWSAAIFAQQFADRIAEEMSNKSVSPNLSRQFNDNRLRLKSAIDHTKSELFAGKEVSNPLFRNDLRIADGNMYGILSHPLGVAINSFASVETLKGEKASYFFVDNCLIKDIEGDVDEVVTLQDPVGAAQKGPSGDLLKLKDCTDGSGRYSPNVLSEMILSLARLKKSGYDFDYGTLNIHDDVLRWANGSGSVDVLLSKGFKFITGQDSMGHHGKGVLGIRIDGTKHVLISHNHIDNIVNRGRLGAEYNKGEIGGKRYNGPDTSGIHISYSDDVWVDKTRVDNITSYNGESCGIKAIHETYGNVLHSLIHNIRSGDKYENGVWLGRDHSNNSRVYRTVHPNDCPSSKGLCWSKNSDLRCENVKIDDLKGPQRLFIAVIE